MGWSDPGPPWSQARRAEAEARDVVSRDVLGFDPEVDLDEDGHAFDGYGARRFGTVPPRPNGPLDEHLSLRRLGELDDLAIDGALYWGGFTHPDWVDKFARHERRGR
jgi:hypothetical protein